MTAPTGRYAYNPAATQANFVTFDKGSYELVVNSVKSFVKKEGDAVKNYGVRILFTIAEGKYATKKGIVSLYLHNEGGQSMAKRFQMAISGFPASEEGEAEFDLKSLEQDWSIDPEVGGVGEAWKELEGARVIADMDVKPRDDDKSQMQQVYKAWRPIVSA